MSAKIIFVSDLYWSEVLLCIGTLTFQTFASLLYTVTQNK